MKISTQILFNFYYFSIGCDRSFWESYPNLPTPQKYTIVAFEEESDRDFERDYSAS